MGVFDTLDANTHGHSPMLQESGIRPTKVYSPTREEEITKLMGMKPSPVRYFTLVGGLTGILFGYGLATYAATPMGVHRLGQAPGGLPPLCDPGIRVLYPFCRLGHAASGWRFIPALPRIRLPRNTTRASAGITSASRSGAGRRGKPRVREILSEAGAVEVKEIGPEVRGRRSEVR